MAVSLDTATIGGGASALVPVACTSTLGRLCGWPGNGAGGGTAPAEGRPLGLQGEAVPAVSARDAPTTEWRSLLLDRLRELLPDATEETRRELGRSAHLRNFRRGDILVAQGRPSQLVLLLTGHAAVRRSSQEDEQLLLSVASAGALLCVSAATFTESPFDFACLSDGMAATWGGDRIRELAANDPGFGLALLDRAASIGLEVTSRIDALAFLDARGRLARAFVEYGDLVFHEQHPTISRSDLPALVGASREMVARCLRYFEARGFLKRNGRTGLVLLDEKGLREYLEDA